MRTRLIAFTLIVFVLADLVVAGRPEMGRASPS